MKPLVVATLIVIILVVAYSYSVLVSAPPTSSKPGKGPVGPFTPTNMVGKFRTWVGKGFRDSKGGFDGMYKREVGVSQHNCYTRCQDESGCGSATWNPENGGTCHRWSPTASTLHVSAPGDVTWSAGYPV